MPDTREKILTAAWTLLEEESGKGVRMADVAKRAGVSRQAVYLHFPGRAELLIATTRYIDQVKDVDGRLAACRSAPTALGRLDAFIDAWGAYIPEVHGVCSALMAMMDSDAAAAAAWDDRMTALREGCAAAVGSLTAEGVLREFEDETSAVDVLWMLLSVRNWEHLTLHCGWSQARYVAGIKEMVRRALVQRGAADDPPS